MSNDLQSPTLSGADLQFWEENGYVVARNAVSEKNAAWAAKAIWDFLEMDPEDPKTWYPDPPLAGYHGGNLSTSGILG